MKKLIDTPPEQYFTIEEVSRNKFYGINRKISSEKFILVTHNGFYDWAQIKGEGQIYVEGRNFNSIKNAIEAVKRHFDVYQFESNKELLLWAAE